MVVSATGKYIGVMRNKRLFPPYKSIKIPLQSDSVVFQTCESNWLLIISTY